MFTIAAVLWPLSFSFVFSRCSPHQPSGILKRKQARYVLIDESAIEIEEDDDVYAGLFEHSSEKSVDDARLSDFLRDDEVGSWDSSKFQEVWRVMSLWSHRPGRNSPYNFEHLLRRVLQEKLAGNVYADAVDTLEMYNGLIHSWAKSRTDGAPQRVEEIFDTMLRLYEAGEITFRPDIGTFNGVLMAYAFSREKASAKESMRILRKLHNLRAEGRTDILPNTDSYSYILRAFATSEGRDAPALVHQMIRNMEQFADKYPAVKPDWKCHNVYLHSLLSTMTMEVKNSAAIAEKMENHLQLMITSDDKDVWPNIWSFNMVISAWSKSGSRKSMVDRGEALFAQLEEYHASCGNSSETEPITHTYNCLIACYSRSNRPDKAERSVAILDRMKELYETHGKASQRPDVVTYNSVMNSYSKARNSNPRMVEQLLRDLHAKYDETGDISFKPTSRSYNTCVSGSSLKNIADILNTIDNSFVARKSLTTMPFSSMHGQNLMSPKPLTRSWRGSIVCRPLTTPEIARLRRTNSHIMHTLRPWPKLDTLISATWRRVCWRQWRKKLEIESAFILSLMYSHLQTQSTASPSVALKMHSNGPIRFYFVWKTSTHPTMETFAQTPILIIGKTNMPR